MIFGCAPRDVKKKDNAGAGNAGLARKAMRRKAAPFKRKSARKHACAAMPLRSMSTSMTTQIPKHSGSDRLLGPFWGLSAPKGRLTNASPHMRTQSMSEAGNFNPTYIVPKRCGLRGPAKSTWPRAPSAVPSERSPPPRPSKSPPLYVSLSRRSCRVHSIPRGAFDAGVGLAHVIGTKALQLDQGSAFFFFFFFFCCLSFFFRSSSSPRTTKHKVVATLGVPKGRSHASRLAPHMQEHRRPTPDTRHKTEDKGQKTEDRR